MEQYMQRNNKIEINPKMKVKGELEASSEKAKAWTYHAVSTGNIKLLLDERVEWMPWMYKQV
eukprot:m.112278 g.112278  ORF g.112278 m.112278 type:complete len:62 (-) comp15320_c0_seq2:834-1019(-)